MVADNDSFLVSNPTKNAKLESVSHSRYYPETKPGKAETLKGFVAFYKNKVEIHS